MGFYRGVKWECFAKTPALTQNSELRASPSIDGLEQKQTISFQWIGCLLTQSLELRLEFWPNSHILHPFKIAIILDN